MSDFLGQRAFQRAVDGARRDYRRAKYGPSRAEAAWYWLRVIVLIVGVPVALYGIGSWIAAYVANGRAVAAAMPPKMVTDKSHTTTSHTYSCGKDCTSTSNSDHFTLFAPDGTSCEVDRRTWAATPKGALYKCSQLYGWQ